MNMGKVGPLLKGRGMGCGPELGVLRGRAMDKGEPWPCQVCGRPQGAGVRAPDRPQASGGRVLAAPTSYLLLLVSYCRMFRMKCIFFRPLCLGDPDMCLALQGRNRPLFPAGPFWPPRGRVAWEGHRAFDRQAPYL